MREDGRLAFATADSKEIGFKYLVPGYNASLNAALFEIEETGGVFYDPNTDSSIQRDTLRSRGFEIEGVTSLNNGLSLQAFYSYVDMKIVDGVDGTTGESTAGNVLTSTPRHTASVWADYTIKDGAFHGLGFGSGVCHIGISYGNDRNTFQNDAHALVDAAAHYDLAGLAAQFAGAHLQLNVSNIADKRDTVCSDNYCYEDQWRTVLGSLRYRW